MEYKLSSPKRKRIFEQFLYNKELRFNEIEKLTGIRSNELAYFIQKLVDEEVLVKDEDLYKLSPHAEKYIPFFVQSEDKMSPLPVVLVACVKEGKVLLWKRNKRPYENHWSLPGGRLRLSETVEQASLRVLKELTFVDGEFLSSNAVVNEKHAGDDGIKHAFLIIFTRTKPLNEIKDKEGIGWFAPNDLPPDTIPSDRWLIQSSLESRIDLTEETLIEKDGRLGMSIARPASKDNF